MSERFFSAQPIAGPEALLAGDEAHHLAQVMRAKVGDEVVLFDGSGAEFPARVAAIGRKEARLAVLGRREVDRMPRRRVTLGVALPKGERQKWLVEKITELGAAMLVPLVTAHGVAQPTDAACERLARAALEAAKQCGRNRLLEIAAPIDARQWFAQAPATALRLIAHPPEADSAAPFPAIDRDEVFAAIGPEGGFSQDELAAAQEHGWQRVSLGERILRVETAAIALAALLTP
jgi:16S rRNA (uracil1498-N3)-methyltransferase